MKSEIKLIFFWITLSMPLVCQSYSAPFYQNQVEGRRPSYYFNDLKFVNGFNNNVPHSNQRYFQKVQTSQKHVNNKIYSGYQDNDLYNPNFKADRLCTSWTSPEGIRFNLPKYSVDKSNRNHGFSIDCDSPRSKSNYSPSYYSPGSASNSFYDYYE